MKFDRTIKYKVVIAASGKQDIKEKKKYILDNFKYRELGENFSRKIKKAAMELEYYPEGYSKTEFEYRSYPIYMKPSDTYFTIYYDNSGRIYSTNHVYLEDMQDVLNLNDPYGYLIGNRKAIIDAVMSRQQRFLFGR